MVDGLYGGGKGVITCSPEEPSEEVIVENLVVIQLLLHIMYLLCMLCSLDHTYYIFLAILISSSKKKRERYKNI